MEPDFTLKASVEQIIDSKISNIVLLNPHSSSSHAVYHVITQVTLNNPRPEIFILKILRTDEIRHSIFWHGLHLLFNKTPEDAIKSQRALARYFNELHTIPAPHIFKFDETSNNILKKPYVLMDEKRGQAILKDSPEAEEFSHNGDIAYQLGLFLGQVHSQNFEYFGNMSGSGEALTHFPHRFAETIRHLGHAPRAKQNIDVQRLLPYYIDAAEKMPVPEQACPIALDLWPNQFLMGTNNIQALVDLDSYVIGPPGLELSLIELWLQKKQAFEEGYLSHGDIWPNFEQEHHIYRFFLYLLYDCPEAGLHACLNAKGFDSQGHAVKSRIQAPRPRPGSYSNPRGPGF
ncbi:MAG: phosphotransferase [Gammaproteobacteria bacterium]